MSPSEGSPPPAPAAGQPQAPLPPPRRRRVWVTLLLCVAIFTGGGIVGGGVMLIHVYRTALSALLHPEKTPGRIAHRMQKRLDLTDAQTDKVEEILGRRQAALLKARADMLEHAAPELDALEDEVAAVLTPEQALLWREQFRRLRRDMALGMNFALPDSLGR